MTAVDSLPKHHCRANRIRGSAQQLRFSGRLSYKPSWFISGLFPVLLLFAKEGRTEDNTEASSGPDVVLQCVCSRFFAPPEAPPWRNVIIHQRTLDGRCSALLAEGNVSMVLMKLSDSAPYSSFITLLGFHQNVRLTVMGMWTRTFQTVPVSRCIHCFLPGGDAPGSSDHEEQEALNKLLLMVLPLLLLIVFIYLMMRRPSGTVRTEPV